MTEPLVLMVEDDADIRELFAGRVRRLGYEVRTASTGEQGLEMAKELLPALVILDIGLPGLDGWQVIDELANDKRTAGIPILVASIVDQDRDVPSVRAHLVKPIGKGHLEQAVKEALET